MPHLGQSLLSSKCCTMQLLQTGRRGGRGGRGLQRKPDHGPLCLTAASADLHSPESSRFTPHSPESSRFSPHRSRLWISHIMTEMFANMKKQRSDLDLPTPWKLLCDEEEEERSAFMVTDRRGDRMDLGEAGSSESQYETCISQEQDWKSHKELLNPPEVPLTLNVDKSGHLRLENLDDLQNILQLRKNKKARKAPAHKTPPPPEAVPYYVDEEDFMKACEENKMALIERYLTRGGDPNACDNFGRSALHKASFHGNVEVVSRLLEGGAYLENKDKLQATAVHCACRGGSQPVLELLLNQNASFSSRDKLLSTPLHVAVRTGHYECAEHLLHCGAEVNAKDREGDTPTHDAVRGNRFKILQLLVLHGANIKLKNAEGKSPMDCVLEWQNGAKNILSKV